MDQYRKNVFRTFRTLPRRLDFEYALSLVSLLAFVLLTVFAGRPDVQAAVSSPNPLTAASDQAAAAAQAGSSVATSQPRIESEFFATLPVAMVGSQPAQGSGIDFLALDLPPDLRESIHWIQSGLRAVINERVPSVANHVRCHPQNSLHISLIRFGHLPHAKRQQYASVVKKSFHHAHGFHHSGQPFNLASKVRGVKHLHLDTKNGWVMFRVAESKTLDRFVQDTIHRLKKKWPGAKCQTDFPHHAHISIARIDIKALSPHQIAALQKAFAENTFEVKCQSFPITHAPHIKESLGNLQYKNVQ